MKRRFRLTRSTDFQRVRRIGKSYAHPLVVLVTARNEPGQVRIGVAAGKAVGKAVRRNQAKRRIRACIDGYMPRLATGWDCIFVARKPAAGASYAEICAAVQVILKKAGLWNEGA